MAQQPTSLANGKYSGLFQKKRTLAQVDSYYEQSGCLGQGSFGVVLLARKKKSGSHLAIKVVKLKVNIKASEPGELRGVCFRSYRV